MLRKLKKIVKWTLIILGVLVVAWAVVHRKAIKAWLTGGEMPEMPEWHKACFKRFLKTEEQ